MGKIVMAICASNDSFGAYSENCEGIWAAGDTVEACKADAEKAIELIKKNLPENQWPAPIKDDYEIEWQCDHQDRVRIVPFAADDLFQEHNQGCRTALYGTVVQ